MWQSARASTGSDRSRLQPPLLVSVARKPTMRFSSSNPASQVAELQLAFEPVRRGLQRRVGVPPADRALVALEALGRNGVAHRDERRQRLVVDLDRLGPLPGLLEGLAEHPADRMAVVHDLTG